MQDEDQTKTFRDTSHVSEVMKEIGNQLSGRNGTVGEGMTAKLAMAIATLADEIETLKNQKP